MTNCVIVGSGNIGTDLLFKMMQSEKLELRAMVGIDPDSDGLARASEMGVDTTADGVDWVRIHANEIDIVFEATSASVHRANAAGYRKLGIVAVDLTPAKIGPSVVPGVNLDSHLNAVNVNLVTCGGQATGPIVAAISHRTPVPYAEIVSTVASKSAGPGTRSNIDEFTEATARCLEEVCGARSGKAIIILNPAEPPIHMRNTVYCALTDEFDEQSVAKAIGEAVKGVQQYVPGYRLRADPVFEKGTFNTPGGDVSYRVVTLLDVAGAGDYLPEFAGNLDIMTAAAVRVGEALSDGRRTSL